jgi:predicted SAM-dependent methyltransferase
MKLNLGCGTDIRKDYVNIDNCSELKPDIVCNLGHEKLPFKNNSVDYIYANHFFEHLDSNETMFLLDELYRVCRDGALIEVISPHQMSPVASHVDHKQSISECFFDSYKTERKKTSGQMKKYFKIEYELSFMRYRPKRTGILKILPFLSIVPCNVHFRLTVLKKKSEIN